MEQERTKSRMPQIGEAVFCIAYLVLDLIAAIVFLSNAGGSQVLRLFGMLMMPKTMAYIWMICMGLGLIGRAI